MQWSVLYFTNLSPTGLEFSVSYYVRGRKGKTGVFILFILLKLRSAVHVDTGSSTVCNSLGTIRPVGLHTDLSLRLRPHKGQTIKLLIHMCFVLKPTSKFKAGRI